ncbi:DNA cytosine methyltransferase [Methylobacterium haplocladii]|uniref:DNA cytosine methyltransferase n=1 Tax=Methylobacterium haplocladii TaxID=1176176 RepID=UPI001EE070C9|nr:DNA cytosine methyltransferase [Methylobacterium haplocladii]
MQTPIIDSLAGPGGRRAAPRRKLLVADLLCGAGGSSTGCQRALAELGLEMDLVAVNHWPTAIATHEKNHPTARHYVQDIATVRPHLLVPEGYLDLLMASPTCTHHSVARGGKPTSDQQRSDPWHIITWLTELRVKRLIIENVWEFVGWGPIDHRTGKPVASRKGEYFRAWIDTIKRLGFQPEWRKLNAADFGDATTRSRFILMARSDRKRLVWPVATHRRRDGTIDLFSGAKPWRPAREIIDWSITGRSIFDRKKALAPKTLARIYAGAVKFRWPEPFLVILRNHMAAQGMDGPLPAITAGGTHIGLAQPMLIKQNFRRDVQGVDEPAPTVMTQARIGVAEPVIVNMKGQSLADGVGLPLPTQTAHAAHIYLAEPFVMAPGSTGAPRATESPLPTITTGGAESEDPGCARPMPVEPFVVSAAHGVDASEADPHSRRTKSVDEPIGTVHAGGGNFGVVEPFVFSRHAEGAPRSIDEPTPTQVAKHSHVLISPYYGSGSGETCTEAEVPLPTVTSKGRFGMVVPVTQSNGGALARDVAEPVPTMTTAKGGEFAVVMPITHHDSSYRVRDAAIDPLPTVTGANRGELAFIAAHFGERDGQAPRTHDIEEPAPTLCATGRVNLVRGTDRYDILFRMLEPHELAAAMGFNEGEARYEFTGTKTEQIKQIGNAVSVAKMKACVSAIMADAAPVRRDDAPVILIAAE